MENGKQRAFAMIDTNLGFTQIGLTKREYFAGLAMQGLCANGTDPEDLAKISVEYADALLKELEDESN
jgi:hypothetical protein